MTVPSRTRTAAAHMLAAWMGSRFYRTFRVTTDGDPAPFDFVLAQRERAVGAAVGVLWDEEPRPAGADALEEMLAADVEADEGIVPGSYAVWVPPKGRIPTEEPEVSDLRVVLSRAMRTLAPGDRREARIPVTVKLAKLQTEGAYVSVVGGLSSVWLAMSEGIPGSFHLDSRPIHRLPEETAEVDILVSRVRDFAVALEPGELTDIPLHDHWVVSRLPDGAPAGVTVITAPAEVDPADGTNIRRRFRQEVQRAVDQKRAGEADLAVLAVVGPFAHIGDELVTASLRGMNPALYTALDLVVVIADGHVRQVLQPRSLPWEQGR
ncbi:MAG: hypothetical protein AB7F65_09215 [Dehalococcoidia bacterium]